MAIINLFQRVYGIEVEIVTYKLIKILNKYKRMIIDIKSVKLPVTLEAYAYLSVLYIFRKGFNHGLNMNFSLCLCLSLSFSLYV